MIVLIMEESTSAPIPSFTHQEHQTNKRPSQASSGVVITLPCEIQPDCDDSSSGVMDIELVNSVSSNPLVDRIFKSAITFVVCIIISGALFALSKLETGAGHVLEVTAAVIFISTMILFALSGLLFMCSIFLMGGETSSNDNKTSMKETRQQQHTNSSKVSTGFTTHGN